MKDKAVLELLRSQRDQFMSGEEMSRRLKVSRSAIWKEMQQLRKMGYEIEALPHLGYRLTRTPDKLFADEIQHGLRTHFIGKKIFSYEALDSTNDACWQLGKSGYKEGVCVFAEHQKKGRGRLGRHWVSPKNKNLLVSILLRPQLLPGEIAKLTLTAGLSVVKTAQKFTGKPLGLKWPNDILYENEKIGGILSEMDAESDRTHFVVVGIGVNLNSDKSELVPHATSLKKILGAEISRVQFARELLEEFEKDYERLREGDFESLSREWENFSVISGKTVTVKLASRTLHGEARGIDRDGALWVRTENGLEERVVAGDIEFFKAQGKS